MKFSHIVYFGVVGIAVAKPAHHKRTAAEIESDLDTVSSNLASFDDSINSFTGTLLQALALLSSYNTLSASVETATDEVTSTGTLDSDDSATIYSQVEDLTTQIVDTLSDAVDKVGCSWSSLLCWHLPCHITPPRVMHVLTVCLNTVRCCRRGWLC